MLSVTERASRLIDMDGLKGLAEPLSELGRDVREAHRPFGPADAAAWTADREECVALVSGLRRSSALEGDLERQLSRVERLGGSAERAGEGTATVSDLFRIKAVLHAAWSIARVLEEAGVVRPCSRLPLSVIELHAALRVLNPEPELRARFVLSDTFSDSLRVAREEAGELEKAHAEARETETAAFEARHGVPFRAGKLTVAAGASHALDGATDLRLVATTGFERIYAPVWSDELERMGEAYVATTVTVRAAETAVLRELSAELVPYTDRLDALQKWLGTIDFGLARIRLARRFQAWPQAADRLSIEDGWVPRSRRQVESCGGTYQPHTFFVSPGVTLLSGPNMGGKTVALTLAGTVQYLAQLGYPVPASSATFRWVSGIDYVGGELSELTSGLSSFAGEMSALTEVLAQTEGCLVLLDELGRSTTPSEGAALAEAAIHVLAETQHTAIVVSHFARVRSVDRVRTLRVVGIRGVETAELDRAVADGGWQAALNSVMNFGLIEDDGGTQASDALRIASAIGVPKSVIDRAAQSLDRDDS